MGTTSRYQADMLELALLRQLGTAGYRLVTDHRGDATLYRHKQGTDLFIYGRGEVHQIDGIADFLFSSQFSHPQRLLLEAKLPVVSGKNIGIGAVLKGMGILLDVGQFWATPAASRIPYPARQRHPAPNPRQRYHYQYAIVSATSFTDNAQQLAYAHDIVLLPLVNNSYFARVLDAIKALDERLVTRGSSHPFPRQQVRMALSLALDLPVAPSIATTTLDRLEIPEQVKGKLEEFVAACHAISMGLIATLPTGLPLLLVSNPAFSFDKLAPLINYGDETFQQHGTLRRTEGRSWIISLGNEDIFACDIPGHMFLLALQEVRDNLGYLTEDGMLPVKVLFADAAQRMIKNGTLGRVITLYVPFDQAMAYASEVETMAEYTADGNEDEDGPELDEEDD